MLWHRLPSAADIVSKLSLTPDLLLLLAERFKALGDPSRLAILNTLKEGELHVTAITEQTGMSQGNASKQLKALYELGFVSRRKEGLFVRYRLADRAVFKLCDLMCDRVAVEKSGQRITARRSARRPARAR
jgi:DNA-binding transcriptional ArsR family regulator